MSPSFCAWVDESAHGPGGALHGGIYLLAATVVDQDACDSIRETLRELLPGKARRLHWHTESPQQRRLIAATLAERPATHTVVIGAPLDPRKPERARRLCMERLMPELDEMAVSRVVIESRTWRDNARDTAMFNALRTARAISGSMQLGFAVPTEDPMLWLPDAVAGAVGAHRRGGDSDPWHSLHNTIHEIDLRLS